MRENASLLIPDFHVGEAQEEQIMHERVEFQVQGIIQKIFLRGA